LKVVELPGKSAIAVLQLFFYFAPPQSIWLSAGSEWIPIWLRLHNTDWELCISIFETPKSQLRNLLLVRISAIIHVSTILPKWGLKLRMPTSVRIRAREFIFLFKHLTSSNSTEWVLNPVTECLIVVFIHQSDDKDSDSLTGRHLEKKAVRWSSLIINKKDSESHTKFNNYSKRKARL
jgi:hypothetical protein